jgi:fructokinase
MNKVLCFGEALIDFISGPQLLSDGLILPSFGQYPGGAPANAAVAVAKLGGQASFIGQVGQDMFGDFLKTALQHYGVDTSALLQHPSAKTALAFVAHDERGERSFSFYRDQSADLLFSTEDLQPHCFDGAKVLHFCSNTLVDPQIADVTAQLLQQARQHGLWLSFDINLRHNLWAEGKADPVVVQAFVEQAELLKFSFDELLYLLNALGLELRPYIQQLLNNKAQLVVITQDDKPLRYFSRYAEGTLAVPQVEVVDTTCGGDAFSGGLLYQLSQLHDLQSCCQSTEMLERSLKFAARCGAFAVTKAGAFPALPALADVACENNNY